MDTVTANIFLPTVPDVKFFNSSACDLPFEADVVSGRYLVDAKSLMGLFSLDLSRSLTLVIHTSPEEAAPFLKTIEKFIVTDDINT